MMYQRGAFKDRYIRYIGDEGWIQVDDETDVVTAEPKSILSLKGGSGAGWGDASDHVRNLLNSIRSRTPTVCNPEVAHRAITICQAWTISLRLGPPAEVGPGQRAVRPGGGQPHALPRAASAMADLAEAKLINPSNFMKTRLLRIAAF